jgi:hypothetical protein
MQSFYRVIFLTFIILGTMLRLTSAQDNTQGTPIEITGVVSQISANTLVVAGLTVDVSGMPLEMNVTVGTTVTITGLIQPNNVVIAQTLIVVIIAIPTAQVTAAPTSEVTPEATSEATPEATATATPSGTTIIVVEGPIINIVNNIITIFDFDIEVEPQHPILNLIEIGDFIHVEGSFVNTGVIVATVVSNISNTTIVSGGGTVGVEGPVESINGNIIVVNGITAQLAPDDPLLQTIQMGNFVSLQGDFQGSGSTIILVVINIIIINNVIVEGNPYCWWHEPGMGMGMGEGHWHCDGMGMGGMGEEGMGMGDDGMGMGMGG